MNAKTAELRTRLLLGSSMLAAIAGLFLLDLRGTFGRVGFGSAVLLATLALGGIREYGQMLRHAGRPVAEVFLVPAAAVALVFGLSAGELGAPDLHVSLVALTVLLLFLTAGRALVSPQRMARGLEEMGATLLGFVLVVWPLVMAQVLALIHLQGLLFVVLVAKGSDIGAYLTGIAFGRHKLIPHVSPGKTVEGALGGLAASVGLALALRGLLLLPEVQISVAGAAALGAVLNLTTQIGDLVESQLKRRCGVKDSSHLLPAHGGILDLVDSLLFTIPTYSLSMAILA